eukprot:gene12337-15513_t
MNVPGVLDTSGRMTTTIVVGSGTYIDPGALATDNYDTTLQSKLLASYAPSFVDTSRPTLSGSPYQDSKVRLVVVLCPAREIPCEGDDGTLSECSTSGVCGVPDLGLASDAGTTDVRYPPTISLVGSSIAQTKQHIKYSMCPPPVRTSTSANACDRGAVSMDSVDGDLSDTVVACWNGKASSKGGAVFSTNGLAACALNPDEWGTYSIIFSVTNSAGLSASVTRTLQVQKACLPGSDPCPDGSCAGDAGACLNADGSVNVNNIISTATSSTTSSTSTSSSTSSTASSTGIPVVNSAPIITARAVPGAGSSVNVVSVKQLQPYVPCVSSKDTICEPGVEVSDAEDGNITDKELRQVGLANCDINTTADVGTTFKITFVVFDNWNPPLKASFVRSIVIAPPCDLGLNLCPPGVCVEIDCISYATLRAQAGGVVLVPGRRQLLQTDTGTDILALAFLFGFKPEALLTMCSSSSDTNCGVSAQDYLGNDLTTQVKLQDVSTCPEGYFCYLCTPDALANEQCQPGEYIFRFSVKDQAGRSHAANVSIVIEIRTEYDAKFTVLMDCGLGAEALSNKDQQTLFRNVTSLYLPQLGANLDFVRKPVLKSLRVQPPVTFPTGTEKPLCMVEVEVSFQYGCTTTSSHFEYTSDCQCRVFWDRSYQNGTLEWPPYKFDGLLGTVVTFNPGEPGTTTCWSFTPRFDIVTASVTGSQSAVSAIALSSASASSSLADMVEKFPEIDDFLQQEDADIVGAWVALVNAMDVNRAVQFKRLQAVINANQANLQASISPVLQAAVVARGGISPSFKFVIPFDPSGGVGATVGNVNESNVYGLWVSDGRSNIPTAPLTTNTTSTPAPQQHPIPTSTPAPRPITDIPTVRTSASDLEAQTNFHCSSPHGLLVDACFDSSTAASSTDVSESGSDQLTEGSSLPHIGIDPSFSTKSVLYNKEVAPNPEEWYNTSAGSGETNSYGFPYGYKSFPGGYPFLFDINLNQARVEHMLTYLKEGSYLTRTATKTLTAQVSSYNRDLQIYGYLKIVFSWSDSGLIKANFLVRALEYRDYTSTGLIFGEMMTRLAVDLALIGMVILYVISAAWDIWKSFMHQRRTQDVQEVMERLKVQDDNPEFTTIGDIIARDMTGTGMKAMPDFSIEAHALDPNDRGPKAARYQTHMSSAWMFYEVALCTIMITALALLFTYAVTLASVMPDQRRYDIYDASSFAHAQPLLLLRHDELTAQATKSAGLTAINAITTTNTTANTNTTAITTSKTFPYPSGCRYDVYDASSFAPAQPLLLLRHDELTAQATESADLTAVNLADAAGISVAEEIANIGAALTTIPSPGKADRWQLETNSTGLDMTAAMMTTMDQMSTYLLLYTMFQGIALCMIMIRLMTHTSFQARLSVITGTIARALPDLICFGYVVMVIGLPLTVLMVIIYGPTYQGSATAEEALLGIFIDMLLGIQDKNNSMIRVMQTSMLHGDSIYAGILAGLLYFLRSLFLIFLLSFLLAMLRGLPGVPQDVARLTKWFFQSFVGAPSNSKMAKLIQQALDVDTAGVLVRMAKAASYMYT